MTDPSNDNGNVRRTEYFALSDLLKRMHPDNPKEHNIGLVIGLIESHGYVELGTIDDRTGLFMAGHGRTEALAVMKQQNMKVPRGIIAKDGEWYVPVSVGYESDNDNKAKAYLVASNESTISGDWNERKLANLLQNIAASTDAVLEDTAMDADRLDELLFVLNFDPQKEWEGMPEFNQNDKPVFISIIVHCETEDDFNNFKELVGQNITDKTRFIYYPEKKKVAKTYVCDTE